MNSVADPEIATALQTLLTAFNGQIDAVNLSAALAQAAAVNQSGQTVKGAANIAASQSTSSGTFTTLATPDQVTGIVMPTNGIIRVWYQARWSESVSGAASAAIFVGANQLKVQQARGSGPVTSAAICSLGSAATNAAQVLCSSSIGLVSMGETIGAGGIQGADITTGQAVGFVGGNNSTNGYVLALLGGNSVQLQTSNPTETAVGGPCDIFAAAGTYTISVQFKVSSGSVTASNRQLWVQALSFT